MKKETVVVTDKKNRIKLSKEDRIFNIITYTLLGILLLLILYPLYFVCIASFSDPALVNSGQVVLYPRGLNFSGYKRIFSYTEVWRGYGMSIFYTVAGTVLNLFLTFTIAYVLTRKNFMAGGLITGFLMVTMFFSGGLIPTYLLVNNIGLYNKPWTLVILNGISIYNVIITRTTIKNSIPEEMYEAAAIDGCDHFRYLRSFIMPLSKPIVAVMTLYYAVGHWNDYMTGLIYINKPEYQPLQLILRNILIQGELMATDLARVEEALIRQQEAELIKYGLIIVSSVPLLIVYPLIQKYFTQGIMIGSVKG